MSLIIASYCILIRGFKHASNSKMVVVTTLLEDPVFYHRGYDKKKLLGWNRIGSIGLTKPFGPNVLNVVLYV